MDPVKSIKSPAIVTILRIPFIVLIALLPGIFASGQVKFTTVASSQEIGLGDYLQIEFVVENAKQIEELNPPDFPGFQVAQGPIQSSGMSIVNGNMSQYKGLSFVLRPTKTGKFRIQGAVAFVDGKKMESNPVTITVNASGSGNSSIFPPATWPVPPASNPMDIEREYVLRPGESIKEKIRKNLFVKLQVDKTACYVGEPIVATYKLYSRLSSESRVSKRPSLNGFSVYDMVDPAADVSSVEKVNGKPFIVHIIRKTQLIPLQTGTVNLDPVEVENTVHFVRGSRQAPARSSGDMMKDLFDRLSDEDAVGPEIEENITLDTKPLPITVRPLPEENRPADFNGAVGHFSIEAALAGKNLAVQDEATLQVVVKGSGNLPVINAPSVQWPSGIEAYEPSAREQVDKTKAPLSGTKTFEYLFTPKNPGHYTIPSIAFSYFDPVAAAYKTTRSGSLDFQVTPALRRTRNSPSPAIVASPPAGTSGLKRFIIQHLESLFGVLILSCLALYLWRQNRQLKRAEQRPRNDPGRTARNTDQVPIPVISSVAKANPLQEVRQSLERGDYKGFYRDLNRAVWKVVTDKLDLPASELNKNNIARKLQAKGWDVDTTRLLENILDECEMNLYTPAYDTENMQQLLRQAEQLFERISELGM